MSVATINSYSWCHCYNLLLTPLLILVDPILLILIYSLIINMEGFSTNADTLANMDDVEVENDYELQDLPIFN